MGIFTERAVCAHFRKGNRAVLAFWSVVGGLIFTMIASLVWGFIGAALMGMFRLFSSRDQLYASIVVVGLVVFCSTTYSLLRRNYVI
ncbi:hypothetical protein [Dyella sp. 20L07]|uniref:hypothetical protein n=1 Tax=Dyella sp. 20L07 TaxID=3384240 RepID=UPI003D26AE61